jgi:glycine/D-amino acid oxidase-like deaminating enzyme
MNRYDILIIGAGIFGVTVALELRRRQYRVAVIERGALPNPAASSTDIGKVVRMEYGRDVQYMSMVESALPGWRRWNDELGETLFHETGVLMLTRQPMSPGGFEHDSYQLLLERGHQPERLNGDEIARRFPAWRPGAYRDGFYHAQGGFVESGRLLQKLILQAEWEGVLFYPMQAAVQLISGNGRVNGVQLENETIHADHLIVAAGTWTPLLVPELAAVMRVVGQPIFHLQTADDRLFSPPHFPVFTADIAQTGWYGFPRHPRQGVVKIANHGLGRLLPREQDAPPVTADDERNLRQFLQDTFPDLAEAAVVYTRCCLYGDTLDGHLWIDRHPQTEGLTVASGGSGHALKFGPILGQLIADAAEGRPNDWLPKFRWRNLDPNSVSEEAARHSLPASGADAV